MNIIYILKCISLKNRSQRIFIVQVMEDCFKDNELLFLQRIEERKLCLNYRKEGSIIIFRIKFFVLDLIFFFRRLRFFFEEIQSREILVFCIWFFRRKSILKLRVWLLNFNSLCGNMFFYIKKKKRVFVIFVLLVFKFFCILIYVINVCRMNF